MNRFSGKSSIVVGGAGGIGSAISRALAKNECCTTIADINISGAQELVKGLSESGTHLALSVDVSDRDSVSRVVKTVIEKQKRIDYLIYCAGNNIKAPSIDLTIEQWQSALDSHLTGAFLFSQAVARQIIKQQSGGKIVFLSSVGAWAPIPERGAYSPSKAALNSLAAMLSIEWAKYGINTNTVCPGVAETPMTTEVYNRDPALRDMRRKRMPISREVLPEEIADLVIFLCSDASNYINGTAIPIDGGFLHSAFMPEKH